MPKKRQVPSMVLKVVAEEQADGSVVILKEKNKVNGKDKMMERLSPNRAMRRAHKANMRRKK